MNYECKVTEDKRCSMLQKIRILNSSETLKVQIIIDRISFWKYNVITERYTPAPPSH